MDFSFLDCFIDAAIVINDQKAVVYANEPAATLFETSLRRLLKVTDLTAQIKFLEKNELYPWQENGLGHGGSSSSIEIDFQLTQGEKKGRAAFCVAPCGEKLWLIAIRDVTLEQALHSKYRSELEAKEDLIKNLEQKVADRTKELREVNGTLSAILESLGEGFLVFDQKGLCGNVYTKSCLDILEAKPAGEQIQTVLKLNEKDKNEFDMWLQAVFSNSLPFDAMKDLAPKQYTHSQGRHIFLEYYPILNAGTEEINSLVLVATDRTAEIEAQKESERQKEYAAMILKMVERRSQFVTFFEKYKQSLVELKAEGFDSREAYRILHTLEGEAGLLNLGDFRLALRVCQEKLQNKLEDYPQSLLDAATALANFEEKNKSVYDKIIGNGEIVREISEVKLRSFKDLIQSHLPHHELLEKFNTDFYLVPASKMVDHYSDLVTTIANTLNKKVNFKLENGSIPIDKNRFEPLMASLVHTIRNSLDHGFESPEDRVAEGKPEEGTLKINFSTSNRNGVELFKIIVSDDGRGIPADKIRKKLSEKYPDEDHSNLSDFEVLQAVLRPNFSTKETVGEFSGRGVGMDAIQGEAEKLGGKVFVDSVLGQGTKIHIYVPMDSVTGLAKAS